MADINDIYGGGDNDRLTAKELIKGDGTYAILQKVVEGTEVVNFAKDGEKDEFKIVLTFVDTEKSVVVNKTNAGLLGARYGADYEKWVGKTVIVTGSPKKFNGSTVPGIDLSAPLVPDAEQAADYAAGAAAGGADADPDVPF